MDVVVVVGFVFLKISEICISAANTENNRVNNTMTFRTSNKTVQTTGAS